VQRVVLITGVAGGIGRATARAFADAGWRVVGADLDARGADHADPFFRADVSEPDAIEAMFTSLHRDVGRLDALVNNAAVQLDKHLVDTEPEEWNRVMRTNVGAAFLAIRAAHALLAASTGCVVNVSSVHAVATSGGLGAYAASKGALLALTRAAALELAPAGVRVNAVLPGATDTDMLRAGLARGHLAGDSTEARLAALAGAHPLGRIGAPREIAEAILFLADHERSSFVTGQALTVDGGALARLSTE
jgi:glucose 1-dehydrogenase